MLRQKGKGEHDKTETIDRMAGEQLASPTAAPYSAEHHCRESWMLAVDAFA
jgi:hypothetical protein